MNIAIVNCFDTYEHRVDLLREAFTSSGNAVSVLTSNFRHFEKVQRTEPKTNYIFFNARPYYKNLSYQRLASHFRLSKDIFSYLEVHANEFDLVWVLVPPNSFVRDAAFFKRNHQNTKIVFDLIDLWPETMPVGFVKNLFPFTVWKKIRDNNVCCADLIVTECNLYKNILKDVIAGTRYETLYLARPVTPFTSSVNLPDDTISLCYLGSINNIIDIEAIESIISFFNNKKRVALHIIGDGERRDLLISSAKSAGASVLFHGKIFDKNEKQRIFDSCHYGLNIMKQTVCVGLTMKSIDYLEAGLPLLNNIHGDTWDFVEEYHLGINWDFHNSESPYSVEMRENARNFFENVLSADVFVNRVNELIEELN